MSRFLEIRGEAFVTLAGAAECYRVELVWVEQVYAAGLLGRGERVGDAIAIAVAELDRLAVLLRWQRHHGLDLETAAALLGP